MWQASFGCVEGQPSPAGIDVGGNGLALRQVEKWPGPNSALWGRGGDLTLQGKEVAAWLQLAGWSLGFGHLAGGRAHN